MELSHRRLGVGPPRQPLVQRERIERASLVASMLLHRGEAAAEAAIGALERILRLNAKGIGEAC